MTTSSAMETEVAATFYNAKEALTFRVTLAEMGHPQPPTPMEVDNETATGSLKSTMKQKRSKAVDMRFYWVRDSVNKNQLMSFQRDSVGFDSWVAMVPRATNMVSSKAIP